MAHLARMETGGSVRSDIDLIFSFSDGKPPLKIMRIVENFQPQDLLKQNYDSDFWKRSQRVHLSCCCIKPFQVT